MALEFPGFGKADGIVEGEAEDFVSVLTARVVKEVLLQVIAKSEERAALSLDSEQNERRSDTLLTASLVAKFLPSGQATRLIVAALAKAARATNAAVSLKTIFAV